MAGTIATGAPSPEIASTDAQQARGAIRVPATSRARSVVGAYAFGCTVVAVYATRRAAVELGVMLTVNDGAAQLVAAMRPTQARDLAALLHLAAADVERRQGVSR